MAPSSSHHPSALRGLAEPVRREAPSLLFLDEVDYGRWEVHLEVDGGDRREVLLAAMEVLRAAVVDDPGWIDLPPREAPCERSASLRPVGAPSGAPRPVI